MCKLSHLLHLIFANLALSGLLVMTTCTHAHTAEPFEPINLSDEQRQRLENGQVLVSVSNRGELHHAEMLAIVPAKIDEVWRLMDERSYYLQWNEQITSLDKIGEVEVRSHMHGVNKMPWPMQERHWGILTESGKRNLGDSTYHFSSWEYIKGSGNIVDSYGYWLGMPYGNTQQATLLKYVVTADFGIHLPNFVINWFTSMVLPQTISDLTATHARLFKAKETTACTTQSGC